MSESDPNHVPPPPRQELPVAGYDFLVLLCIFLENFSGFCSLLCGLLCVAEDGKIQGIDNQSHPFNNAFSRRDIEAPPSQSGADDLETLTLVNSFYPAGVAKPVVLKKSAERKSELASLIDLDDSLFCLDVGANPSTVKVSCQTWSKYFFLLRCVF